MSTTQSFDASVQNQLIATEVARTFVKALQNTRKHSAAFDLTPFALLRILPIEDKLVALDAIVADAELYKFPIGFPMHIGTVIGAFARDIGIPMERGLPVVCGRIHVHKIEQQEAIFDGYHKAYDIKPEANPFANVTSIKRA